MTEQVYRKLTPKHRAIFRFSQAWLADDHLLVVISEWCTERYQRFALADIQAVVLTDGPELRLRPFIGAVSALTWIGLTLLVDSAAAKAFFILTGMAGLALAARGLLRPRRCYCLLQTSVSRVPLFPVWHRGIARDFVAAISGPIEEAQRQISAVEPSPPPAGMPADRELITSEIAVDSTIHPPPPEIRHPRNYIGEAFFGVLLMDALLMAMILGYPKGNLTALMTTVYLAEILLAGLALFYERSKLAGVPGLIVMICTGVMLADLTTVSGVAGVRAFMASAQTPNAPPIMHGSFWLSPMATLWFATAWRVAGGLPGLILLIRERRSQPA